MGGMLAQAGPSIQLGGSGHWLASLPQAEREQIQAEQPELFEQWDDIWGDRINEFVMIGVDMKRAEVEQALDRCLLTEDEMIQDWSQFFDPLPQWPVAAAKEATPA